MGWNDRLPEDPNWPYPSQADSDAYESWHEYMLAFEEEMASQNLDPALLAELETVRKNLAGRQTELPPSRPEIQAPQPEVKSSPPS